MIKTIKKAKGAHGNMLEFLTTDLIKCEHIIVIDKDCQKERVYKIGGTHELDDFEHVKIESKEQVIKSWTSGKLWF